MKTLVIVSHPDILESSSQQYFLNSVPDKEDVTIHHLEKTYPNGKIDVAKEQELLNQHDRILFQFPFYWYSSPALLKHWQDEVLAYDFAHGKKGNALVGKEFGLILMIGVNESDYQAGGKEQFSISELTKPYQAMAYKTGMIYLKPLSIFQFSFMTEEEKMEMLVAYQQMLTNENDSSLESREKWLIKQLKNTDKATLKSGDDTTLIHAIDLIEENRETIDELKLVLEQMY
ncbi:NAD(P)H-dependent oxidoreductase [Lentibacillus sp. Marseille-P4043]|uniref:NAD(P)H-dependent oxidoreductase n=1 Tax=Lentibacillus sp. Marseille-P4043 TaxID=2040293 RepID=UPI000D0B312E|nr:NAD(P)H-dependent oxidoreductase [Lentibacillus sp. Marseille-P4043]